jgi:hypothetical protein
MRRTVGFVGLSGARARSLRRIKDEKEDEDAFRRRHGMSKLEAAFAAIEPKKEKERRVLTLDEEDALESTTMVLAKLMSPW